MKVDWMPFTGMCDLSWNKEYWFQLKDGSRHLKAPCNFVYPTGGIVAYAEYEPPDPYIPPEPPISDEDVGRWIRCAPDWVWSICPTAKRDCRITPCDGDFFRYPTLDAAIRAHPWHKTGGE